MDCCGLSSTGLKNIDANEITSDNISIFSNLNVSGTTNLNKLIVNNNVSFISSLNVSGYTSLNNKTTISSSLNVSGFTNLGNTTNINGSLYISGLNVLSTLNSLGTGLSTLYNFRSDNESALITQENTTFSTLIHGVYPGSEIKFGTILSKNNAFLQLTGTEFLTKIDSDGKLCIYHPFNILLPTRFEGYWVIHDELESLHKQAIINVGKFEAHDLAIGRTTIVASGAAAGVATIGTYLGLSSILDDLTGGGGGGSNPPAPVDVFAINMQLNDNTNKINNLSSSSILSINTLNNTTNSILGYINNLTRYSILSSNGLDVSGVSIIYGNTSLLSSLNVSGYTTLNNNTTLVSSLNVSGFTKFNNNTTLLSSLNVSGFTTLNNNTTLLSSLSISGFSTFNNNVTFLSLLNVSGFTTLNNNTTLVSSLNVSGFTTLNNNITLLSSLNVSGFTTLNKNVTLLSSLNVSGRTILGNTIYDYSDSILEVNKNFNIRNNITNGSRINLQVGTGTGSSYLSMEEGYDINLVTPLYGTSQSTIRLASNKQINLEAPDVYVSNNLNINGLVTSLNIGVKSPLFFTTNRNMSIDGVSFSVYDIDLRKYTKSILLDGYSIRQFRIRHWPADADFETGPSTYQYYLKNYNIFMSNKNGLKLYSLTSPIDNQFLTETTQSHFLYRNTFDYLIYCSRYGAVKVYFIIEDLL